MTSSFSSNELLKSVSNYPITKGDLPGHEFHGNQWVSRSGDAESHAKEAFSLQHRDNEGRNPVADVVASHLRAAGVHNRLQQELYREGMDKGEGAFLTASQAHSEAEAAHRAAALLAQDRLGKYGDKVDFYRMPHNQDMSMSERQGANAWRLSQKATAETERATGQPVSPAKR